MLNRETSWLYQDLERVLLTREQIEARVAQLGAQISRDYAGSMPVCVWGFSKAPRRFIAI